MVQGRQAITPSTGAFREHAQHFLPPCPPLGKRTAVGSVNGIPTNTKYRKTFKDAKEKGVTKTLDGREVPT